MTDRMSVVNRPMATLSTVGLVVIALLTGACAGILGTSPDIEPTIPVTAREVRTDLQPLNPEQCDDLANNLKQLGAPVTTEQAPFQDQIAGNVGMGCQITASGTAVQFVSPKAVADRVRAFMTAQSWQEDSGYAADGPTGTATAFRKDTSMCLFSASWNLSPDVVCPPNQPVSECKAPAEKQIYTILLHCVQ